MQSKLYLLFVILSTFIICSISVEQKPRKTDATVDSKKKVVAYDKDYNYQKDKIVNDDFNDHDDEVDDYRALSSSYVDHRYSPLNPSEANYRTRARGPAPPPPPQSQLASAFDDFMSGNEWSRNDYPSIFPGSLPSMSYDSNPMLSHGPACHSLIDSQYPIFSDTCGAVPQARYALPNSFGHRERWQIAQVLTTLIGASSDPGCTRSLRLLLCPILFPPCPTRHEPPPVLPCQSYCRAIKARCAIPTLDLLPCEVLPYSSDLCPTNQPYGSFIPPGAYPSVNQPSPMINGIPPSNFPMSRSFPSLQSLLSSQGYQSAQPTSPQNLYNSGQYATDNFASTLADYSSRPYGNDYRQASRYAPFTRSSIETRPASETHPSNGAPVIRA